MLAAIAANRTRSAMPSPMGIAALIEQAQHERRPVRLEEAQRLLGSALREADLARETLLFRGADILLPSGTWVRVLRRIQDEYAHG